MSGKGEVSRRRVLAGGAAAAVGGLFWISAPAPAQDVSRSALQVDVEPVEIPQAELDAVAEALRNGQALQRSQALRSAGAPRNLRVISVRMVEPPKIRGSAVAGRPARERWQAIAYDYDAQRALMLQGRLGETAPDRAEPMAGQPIPSLQEWRDARDLLRRHAYFGPLLRGGDLIAYRPMPPVTVGPGGRRLVTVGLLPRIAGDAALLELLPGDDAAHEIVGVDLGDASVRRFAARAPRSALADDGPTCGAPLAAGEETSGRMGSGEYIVRIRREGALIWKFTVVRPAASSGLNGSGIELRDVYYKGRKVLHRAHLPILNVSYRDDLCGPFRDWQYQESRLTATGREIAPGFIRASTEPQTIIQNGTDVGTFLGTALWIDGEEVTLTAELEAGWYRYASQWTLHMDGTIKPRFGFAGVQNDCVCNAHYHHAYWRLDFDIGEAEDNYVQQFANGAWRTLRSERKVFRDAGMQRRWRIRTGSGRALYEIRPGRDDGRARASPDWPFSHGDLWFLRHRENQIDDGVPDLEGPQAVARIDDFIQREGIAGSDLVVWYAGHYIHDNGGAEEAGGHNNLLGPDLVPRNW